MSTTTQQPVYQDARPVLVGWAALLLLGGLLATGWQAGLAGYVGVQRTESPWTYLKAAERYEADKNWARALEALQEAARRGPKAPDPYERMGFIHYEHRQDWTAALAAYREALARGSDSIDARGKIIWSLIHLKRNTEAAAFGQVCIDEGHSSAYFPRYTGEALFRGNEHAKAIPYLEQALKNFPTDILLMERLLACYTKVGDADNARKMEVRRRANEG